MVVSARALSQAVAPASHRGNDLAFGQTGGVPHGQILASPVRMMYQFLGVSTPAGGQCHFQRVHRQAGAEGGGGLPSHYVLGVGIDDERRVHPPSPRANVRVGVGPGRPFLLFGWWVSPARPPNRTCNFHCIRLSMCSCHGFGLSCGCALPWCWDCGAPIAIAHDGEPVWSEHFYLSGADLPSG